MTQTEAVSNFFFWKKGEEGRHMGRYPMYSEMRGPETVEKFCPIKK